MLKGNLPPSQLLNDLIALPTPCKDVVYYPAQLAILGTQGKYSVFQIMSKKSGIAYIAITQPDRVRIRRGGSPELISNTYESIPWREVKLSNENGIFFYKESPSLEALEDYFEGEENHV